MNIYIGTLKKIVIKIKKKLCLHECPGSIGKKCRYTDKNVNILEYY
jgi:hypothetical protein